MDTMSKAWAVLLLFVLPGTVVGFDVEPGAKISLACPQAVSRSQASLETVVEKEKENYLYRYRVSSPSQTPPFYFAHLRIEWSENAALKSWQENIFESCRISTVRRRGQALICWAKIPPVSSDETGEIVIESPEGPRLSRYVIETTIPASERVLTASFRQALLPYFDNNEYLLTESVYDGIMQDCDSAQHVSRFSDAIVGATLSPSGADARSDATRPVIHTVRRSEFAGFRAYAESAEGAKAGSEALIAVDAFGEVLSEGEAAAGRAPERCNMDSIFVFPESALGEEGLEGRPVRVIDHHPDKALYAITLTPRKPCPVVEQQFTLEVPAAR